MISQQTIQKILDTSQIEEVIGEFVSLKKRGVNHIGRCPFHNEKTPSFTVSPSKGIYKCFGCGAAGNSVKFLMEHEHYAYPEALKYLANKYQIPIEEDENKIDKTEQSLKDSLFIITGFAQKFYTDQLLNTDDGKTIGLSYFKERGFIDNSIRNFQLGFAPNSFDAFTTEAIKEGYQIEFLYKLGLTSQKNGKNFDFFRDRILFPIHNLSGKIIGFGGRTLKNDKNSPKYLNSPETEIYAKSKILYGMYFAKKAIAKQDECFVVEGYTDVISMHQAEIENVVAPCGTSLTTEHARLIKRYSDNVTLLYDGDTAGIKAALKNLETVLEQGLNVKIVVLPENEDPDSFIKKNGKDSFIEFLNQNKKDFIFFQTDILLQESKHDIAKKGTVIKDIISTLIKIHDPIQRSVYVKECSKLLEVDEQLLFNELNKQKRIHLEKNFSISSNDSSLLSSQYIGDVDHYQPEVGNADDFQEKDMIRLILEFGNKFMDEQTSVASYILNELEEIEIINPVYKLFLENFKNQIQSSHVIDVNFFINHSDKKISEITLSLLSDPHHISKNWEEKHDIYIKEKQTNFVSDVHSSLNRLKLKKVIRMIQENEYKMKETVETDEQITLQKVHQHLMIVKKQLCEILGTVIIN